MVFGWPVQPSLETMTYSDRPFLGHHLLDRHGDDHQEEGEEDEQLKGSSNVQEFSGMPWKGTNWPKLVWMGRVS